MKNLFSLIIITASFLRYCVVSAAPATTGTVVVTSAASGGSTAVGTLTWAIYQANYGTAGFYDITFNLPPSANEIQITLTETLFIARPMHINGTTQQGYAGQPRIRINCGGLASGFNIVPAGSGLPGGGGSTIEGFRITNYSSNAITISKGANANVIAKNQIGFTPSGNTFVRNVTAFPGCRGIGIQSNSNIIRDNIISGVDNGITIGDSISAPTGTNYTGNVFQRNFIGTDATGTRKVGNDSDGIFLGAGARQSQIGPGNVLSGMNSSGVELLHSTVTGNVIFGNIIGLNAAGTQVIGNSELGVLIANGAAGNTVGGPYGGAYPGNVISGNTLGGVVIGLDNFPGPNGTNSNRVEGNFIGTNGAHTAKLGTQGTGITVQTNSRSNVLRRNVLVGHSQHGVFFANASSNATYGNWIGLTNTGGIVANSGYGVYLLNASNNTVQLPSGSVQAGMERNIFGQNTLGPVGMSGTSTGNVVNFTPDPPKLDLNGDAKSDFVLRNSSTGGTSLWYLNNNVHTSSAVGPTLPSGWKLVDVADFNRDTHPDYLLFNANTRQTAIWYLSGPNRTGAANGPPIPAGYDLIAAGDFNNDGRPDYLLFNGATRRTVVWYLNNNVHTSSVYGPVLPANYTVAGVGDFNRNGQLDLALFNAGTRQTAIWYLSDSALTGSAYGPAISAGYTLTGVGDFNGDAKPDYVLYETATRRTVLWYLNNNVRIAGVYGPTLPGGYVLDVP
jgi:hypothetical protein